jgi:adenylyltransferase/sulfurtransferase
VELGRVPTTPLAASIIGAMQVQEAIKVIHGNDDKLLVGERVYYEGMNNDFIRFKTRPIRTDCLSHFTYDPIIEVPDLQAELSVRKSLEILRAHFYDPEAYIELDEELVSEITTKETEQTHQVLAPKSAFDDQMIAQFQGKPHEEIVITHSYGELNADFPHQDITLKMAGIPPLHIVRVRANGKLHFVELSGDEE